MMENPPLYFWTDTHCHLSMDSMLEDLDPILERAKTANVKRIINIAVDAPSLEKGFLLKKEGIKIDHAAAITPHDVEKDPGFFSLVEKAAQEKKLVAIGETGLDYYYLHASKKSQIAMFEKHIELATRENLPLIIHCRDAFSDLFSLLEGFSNPLIMHCFTGTIKEAKVALDRGYFISFSGIVTFPKSTLLHTVAEYTPIDRILLETDAPYLAPQGKRGKKNEPSFLPITGAYVAHLKGISEDEVAYKTSKNAKQIFN